MNTAQQAANGAISALGDLITRIEAQDAALTALHSERLANGSPAEAQRLATKREGLRIALDDARQEFDLAVARHNGTEARTGYESLVADAVVPLSHYSSALDEIHALRAALAYEAGGIVAHTELKTFPTSRRKVAHTQVQRMRAAARGAASHTYGGIASQVLNHALALAGAPTTLTRHEFETQRGLNAARPGANR